MQNEVVQFKPALITSEVTQMFTANPRVGQQMHRERCRDNARDIHGHFASGGSEADASQMMANRSRTQLCRKFRSNSSLCTLRRFSLLVGVLLVLFLGAKANAKGFQRNLEAFFGIVDQDGNGEIEQGEASKFLRKLDALLTDEGDVDTKEGMSELMASSQFDFNFSYGGKTISAEEMLDHLSNMMTANHVVDWVTHGLQLPQYAEAFRQNAINDVRTLSNGNTVRAWYLPDGGALLWESRIEANPGFNLGLISLPVDVDGNKVNDLLFYGGSIVTAFSGA